MSRAKYFCGKAVNNDGGGNTTTTARDYTLTELDGLLSCARKPRVFLIRHRRHARLAGRGLRTEDLLGSRIAKGVQVAKQVLFVWIEALHEFGIVQQLLPLSLRHVTKRLQAALDYLAAVLRKLLPSWCEVISYVLALSGGHRPKNLFTMGDRTLLIRRQTVILLQASANLLLALRGQALESRIVAHEALPILGRHLLEFLNPLGGQPSHGPGVRGVISLPVSLVRALGRVLPGWRGCSPLGLRADRE